MNAELTKRKRGRPAGHKRFTERLPSVLVTPDDVGKLEQILAERQVSASALLRELIDHEHRRVMRETKRRKAGSLGISEASAPGLEYAAGFER